MSPIRNQLVDMIDTLPETEQLLILEIVKRMAVDDDIATVDDIAAIKAAEQEYKNGETVNHNDINWD